MEKLTKIIFGLALLAGVSFGIGASFAAEIPAIDENDRVVLHGNVHPEARPQFDIGPTDPSLPMNRVILLLKIAPNKQAALDRLLIEQQDPSSPSFHRWLKPEEFGERFGRSPEETQTVKGWLVSHGLTINETAKGGNWINFSGTAAQVESAFRVQIHDYNVDGRLHHANSNDPSIPCALADVVLGPVTLHDFRPKPAHTKARQMSEGERQPGYTYSYEGETYQALAPGDFAVIYDVNAVYKQGHDGTGVTIALVEQTLPNASPNSWNFFRSTFGLPSNPPNVIVAYGNNPGDTGVDDDSEADLDVEWAGAVAPRATIDFVTSGQGTTTTGLSSSGVDLSAQYIVDNDLAPIVSYCYTTCEPDMGTNWQAFYTTIWAQAASQGMTVFVVSGDAGAYACLDDSGSPYQYSKAVNGLASTPYNIAVGGTRFNYSATNSATYWSNGNTVNDVSALGYIPEIAWNDLWAYSSSYGSVQDYEAASGGGASSVYPKPSWQVSPGVPTGNARYMPDVSLNADDINVPYLVYTCTNSSGACIMPAQNTPLSSWPMFGGTSGAAPSFAGIMALLVQSAGGAWQGNFNAAFYKFGQAQYGNKSGALAVFHDITSGTNGFVGDGVDLPGYSCGVGYSQVTGLGSVDALNLLQAFKENLTVTGFAVSAASSSTTVGKAFNFTVTPLDPSTSNVISDYFCTLHFSSTDSSAVLPADTALTGQGTFSAVLNTPGSQTITATNTQNAAITGTSNAITVNQQTGSLKVTLSPAGAIAAGAKWSADGGSTWQASGTTLENIPVGPCIVTYSQGVAGWTPPASKTVTVSNNRTTAVSGVYVEQMGSLKVTVTPPAPAGAEWSYDGGKTWHASGSTVSLQVGVHTVSFKSITGWNAPEAQSVTVLQNQTTQVSGAYVQQTGSLTVTITPQAAVTDGAEWIYSSSKTWQTSGTTVSLPVGTYTVTFKSITGWNTPAAQKATVTYGGSATVSAAYVQQTGSLKVTITPAHRV